MKRFILLLAHEQWSEKLLLLQIIIKTILLKTVNYNYNYHILWEKRTFLNATLLNKLKDILIAALVRNAATLRTLVLSTLSQ